MKNNKSLRILSYIVISYMLMALLWWAVLLHRKNNEAFIAKSELLKEQFIHSTKVSNVDLTELSGYAELKASHERQMYMIFGEAIVFGFTLIIGIYFINRAYSRELASTEKQRNFLLSITHELKSPLASINLILSTFIKRDLPSEKIKELSQDGIQESERLENLFNKILISTRLGQANPLILEPNNLSKLVDGLASGFAKKHPDVTFSKEITPNIIQDIDQDGMVSVVTNLLENAYKYSAENKMIDVNLTTKNDNTILTISDNGIGISKEEKPRIFDQFYRVGNEDTRKTKGTGLGLYIVQQIVYEHKGKIKVEDNPSGGTKFIISL